MLNRHQIVDAICGALVIATLAQAIQGHSDKEVLSELKEFLQMQNPINRGAYEGWLESDTSPCHWKGVGCQADGRVYSLNLSSSDISGPCFSNFSRLTRLTHLDLSANSITGELQADLKHCWSLQYLNLSNNLIEGVLDVSNLTNLRTLDVSQNRFQKSININFPAICGNLTFFSVSSNHLTGQINGLFDSCFKLRHVDLSWNSFTGTVWRGVWRFTTFKANNNHLTGHVVSGIFPKGCQLQNLNIAGNYLHGSFPSSIANCAGLKLLSLWDNSFRGPIPAGIGSLAALEELILANNHFDYKMPFELKNCTNLKYLDISFNRFGGKIQEVFGKLTSLRNLFLFGNNYTGGIISSGILRLPHLCVLGLGFNKFSGQLPSGISAKTNMKALILNTNNFSGRIPPEYGLLTRLQTLDLSYNNLYGEIPPQIGNLTSLLLLMLAGNQFSGQIPKEIGNCSSLLWLNIVANRLSGKIPPEMANIGSDPSPTFMENRKNADQLQPITNKCQPIDRWVPASYPEFSYVRLMMMSQKNCRTVWMRLQMGYDPLPPSSPLRTALGYVQLSGNLLSGEIPSTIGRIRNLALLLLDDNQLSGRLPSEIGQLKLVAMNISNNDISGEIPADIGHMDSLESLDLSGNNFSGAIPANLNQLTKLSKLNLSYNPLLSGNVPRTGQLCTFDEQSFLGDPLVCLQSHSGSSCHYSPPSDFSSDDSETHSTKEEVIVAVIAFLAFLYVTLVIREFQSFMHLYSIVSVRIGNCMPSPQ